jgi:hypothetical protein
MRLALQSLYLLDWPLLKPVANDNQRAATLEWPC